MPKRDYSKLPPENARVLRAYDDAKKRNPDLTQGEFMAVWHTSRRTGKPINATIGTEKYNRKILQSEARYFRLIREGKRKPSKLLQQAERWNHRVQVTMGEGNQKKSFDMQVHKGISKLDIFKLRDNATFKRIAKQHAKAFDNRYGTGLQDDMDETLEMRPVQHFGPRAKVVEFTENL